jgi:5-methylcytosine-specific restriction endonuclease McrA
VKILTTISDWATGRAPWGVVRSAQWKALRKSFLKKNPQCASCGKKKDLQVHHVIPFYLDATLELLESNLITLCRACHFFVGHLRYWKAFNPEVKRDSDFWREKISKRAIGVKP